MFNYAFSIPIIHPLVLNYNPKFNIKKLIINKDKVNDITFLDKLSIKSQSPLHNEGGSQLIFINIKSG